MNSCTYDDGYGKEYFLTTSITFRRSFDDDAVVSPHQSPSIDLADSTTFDNASGETTPFRIPEDAQIYSYDSEGKFYSFVSAITL